MGDGRWKMEEKERANSLEANSNFEMNPGQGNK
jgi:hypothetical protein